MTLDNERELAIMEGVGKTDLYIPIKLYPFQIIKEKP